MTDEVTNVGHDRQQLAPGRSSDAGDRPGRLTALADRGYFNGEQIRKCEQHGIAALVPKPLTSNNHAAGLFDKRDFVYIPEDAYRCPAGEHAIYRMRPCGGGTHDPPLLVLGLSALPAESALHHGRLPAYLALGA